MLCPVVEVFGEPHGRLDHAGEAVVLLVGGCVVLRVVEGVPQRPVVLLRQAEQHADHLDRKHRGEVLHEVELGRPDECLGRAFEERGDLRLDPSDGPGSEHA